MSFTPNTAVTETATVTETKELQLTVFKLHEVRMQYAPDGSVGRVRVTWSKGYMEGDNYIAASSQTTVLDGEVLDGKLLGVEKAVWLLLNDQSLLPAGSAE